MKFEPETAAGVNVITRHEAGRVWVGNAAHDHSLLVPWTGEARAWGVARFEDLAPAHFEALLALEPELVIFGSGARLRFPAPALLAALYARRVGFETMDTAAACRTYNVLVAEGRSVLAALLLPSEAA